MTFLRWLFLTREGWLSMAILALLGAGWWLVASIEQRGYDKATAEHAEALATAERKQRAAERERDRVTDEIAAAVREQARAASQETQAATTQSRERIRTVVRTVQAACPDPVPVPARDELNAMIARANEAHRNRKQRRGG